MDLLALAQVLAESSKPMLLHVGYDSHGDFMSLVEKVPKLKLILAHTGYPCYADTWKLIKYHENIFVDISADVYVNEAITRKAVTYLGPERCLFGTDGPYGNKAGDELFDNGFIKRRVERLFPDQGVQRQILGDNFRALIDQ